jgi:hypothetical protein
MAMNGIGPLVSQWVHDRNDARRAERTGETATPPVEAPAPTTMTSTADSATFTPEALARFETWKTRHGVATPAQTPVTTPEPITTPIVTADPVDPFYIPAPGTTNGEPA